MLDSRVLFQSEIVRRRKPFIHADSDHALFQAEYVKVLPQVYSIEKGLCFIFPSGLMFNSFFLDSDQFNLSPGARLRIKSYSRSLLSIFSIRKVVKLERALFITNLNSVNFFHWFLDVLQKAEGLASLVGQEALKSFTIVLPANHENEFMKRSLDAFDLDCRWLEKDELAIINHATLIPNVAPTGNYRKNVVQSLRKRLVDHFANDCHLNGGKFKIYITRKNAKKRKIINEDQLLPILKKNDFLIVDFDDLAFPEQIRYTTGADVLVSLHGAGLTHMLWMKNPGRVLEIRARDDCHNNCYYTLATDLGLEYHYAIADKVDSTQTTQVADYVIDKTNFENRLLRMLDC